MASDYNFVEDKIKKIFLKTYQTSECSKYIMNTLNTDKYHQHLLQVEVAVT